MQAEAPAEGVGEEQQDDHADEVREEVGGDPEPDQVADTGHDGDDEHVAHEVGGGAPPRTAERAIGKPGTVR